MRYPFLFFPLFVALLSLVCSDLKAQLFADNFEEYAAGSVVSWESGNGPRVVDAATVDGFGRPNRSAMFDRSSRKLMTPLLGQATGKVTTFALDFFEGSGIRISA